MLVRADFMPIEWSGCGLFWIGAMYQARPGRLRDIEQDVSSEDVPEGLESP